MVSLLKKGTSILSSQQTSIMSAASLIGALSFASAFLGIIKGRVQESVFIGTEGKQLIDAFLAAFRVPDFLYQILVIGMLSATFIPVYTRVMDHKEERERLLGSLITIVSIAYIVFAIVVGLAAKPIVSLLTGDQFTPAQIDLSASLMRIMLGAQFLFLISNFMSGILQSNRRFILPALSPLFYNLGIILGTYFLSPIIGIYGAAVGVFIGALGHLFVQLPFALKYGFRYKPYLSWKDPNVREVMKLMLPRGATQTTNSIEDFFQIFIATSFGSTLIRIVEYSTRLTAAPIRFFGVSIAQAALPFLSSEAKEKDVIGFSKLLVKTLHQIAFFMFPAGALLLVLRIPIVRLGYGAKGLPWEDTVLIGRMVALFSISIAATAMIHVVLRAYYALKETWTPFLIAFFAMVINVLTMWLGANVFGWGVLAVPIGSSVAAFTELLILLIVLFKRLHVFSWKEFFYPQSKIIIASACMAVSLYIPMKILDQLVFDTTRTLGLLALTGIASATGLLVYLFFCLLFAVEQLSIVASIHGKLREALTKLSKTTEVISVAEGEEV